MGQLITVCLGSDAGKHEELCEEPKVYSWDKRSTTDPNEFIFKNITDETAIKKAGTINGQQFNIENCNNSTLLVLDWTASVTIDDCVDCKIILGPCKGSIFIRDCSNCDLIGACQQFRTRDCKNMNIFLHCATQPIIEASSQMKFSCVQWSYPELKDQYDESKLSVWNNNWSKIHDFTPVEGLSNFSLLPLEINFYDLVKLTPIAESALPDITTENSLVPLTHGTRRKTSKENVFIMIFSNKVEQASKRCQSLYTKHVKTTNDSQLVLVQTKETNMSSSDLERILGMKAFGSYAQYGPVVGAEFCGPESKLRLEEIVKELNESQNVYIAEVGQQTTHLLQNFYNYCDMQMGS